MGKAKIEQKREINFFTALAQYEQEKQKSEKNGRSNVMIAIAMAVVLLCGYASYTVFQDRLLTKKITEMKSFVEDEQNAQVYAEKSKVRGDTAALTAYNEACTVYIKALKETPRVEGINFAQVKKQLPENVSILEFNYTDPVLTVKCETTDKNAPSKFAENLTKSGDFDEVTYDGFDSIGQLEGDVYNFAIQCKLW